MWLPFGAAFAFINGSCGDYGSLLAWDGPFRAVGGGGGGVGWLWAVSKVKSSARARLASNFYPAGKLQWHFTCGFDFRQSLWLPFEAAFAVLKGLNRNNSITQPNKRKICFFFIYDESVKVPVTAQKMKFSIKNFFSKCDQHIYWRNP